MSYVIQFCIPWLSTAPNSKESKAATKIVKWCGSKVGKVKLDKGFAIFYVDRAFSPRSSAVENGRALQFLLHALCELDKVFLIANPDCPNLFSTKVPYSRTEVWDTIPALYNRGYGDCKTLSAARIAELQLCGYSCRPIFRFVQLDAKGNQIPMNAAPGGAIFDKASGVMYHILVAYFAPNGKIIFEDPSKIHGMQVPQEFQ